jgi:hypothetical protein
MQALEAESHEQPGALLQAVWPEEASERQVPDWVLFREHVGLRHAAGNHVYVVEVHHEQVTADEQLSYSAWDITAPLLYFLHANELQFSS